MVGTVVFFLLVGWLACAFIMSFTAGAAARRAQRREDLLRQQVFAARSREAQPAESMARSLP